MEASRSVASTTLTKEAGRSVVNTSLNMGDGTSMLYHRRMVGQSSLYPSKLMATTYLLRLVYPSTACSQTIKDLICAKWNFKHKLSVHSMYSMISTSNLIEKVPLRLQDLSH